MALNIIDIKILIFFYKKQEMTLSEILKKFPEKKYATTARLDYLSECGYIEEDKEWQSDEVLTLILNSTGKFSITELGKKTVQDIKMSKIESIKRNVYTFFIEIMRSIFCPIIVAFLTALLTSAFYDKIVTWLSNKP